MTLKLLTEHHLEFLSFKGGCTGSSESTLAKNILLEIACHGSIYIQLYRQCANDKVSLRICTGPQEHLLFTHWHSVRKLTFLALIALRARAALNAHAEVFCRKRGLNFGLSLHLHPYFVHRGNEEYCKSEHLHRPV